ncbi:MAG: response regulator [Butyrivibrio sp.]|uniref:response regulator transcription factor n=1 Tax=Butyrivibrio sp. TaxID=28121 RepID=UPI001B47C554|nr:response regulator [Butyrivibrio sp.]MBP3274115.1 response regulator [Butyrivibrio sp.]MBP3782538.1 response regulator [Butyrivibrio sp.]MBP3813952.1 response regulator [Butyrivibrio sp.]
MYKVLIVDDEPVIVEGLRKIVDWEKYNCVVVGTASSGKEGLEMTEKYQPDILFTDIRMPGMDGLTMIAALRSEHRNMQIVILTGYRDFEYARTALNLGVFRYLVKPSKMKELDEAMESLTERLDKLGRSKEQEALEDTENANNFVVKQALSYIEQHYKEKLQLTDVAEKVYVSHWHLSKLLNSTGKSFSDLLNEVRIENAKKLMEDSSLHIADISERVGFADTAHFSRVFKKYTGMSAGEYRNKYLR